MTIVISQRALAMLLFFTLASALIIFLLDTLATVEDAPARVFYPVQVSPALRRPAAVAHKPAQKESTPDA